MDVYQSSYIDKGKGRATEPSEAGSPDTNILGKPEAPALSPALLTLVCDPMLQTQAEKLFREKLVLDGTEVIRLSVFQMLCRTFPAAYARVLLEKRDVFCSSTRLATWAKMYNLTSHLDEAPASSLLPWGERELAQAWTFSAYVSASTLEHSIDAVSAFVRDLARRSIDEYFLLNVGSGGVARLVSASSVGPSDQYSPISPQLVFAPPFPPTMHHPQLHAIPATAPGALFALRQRATMEKLVVTFKELQSGPDHQCTWTEILFLDGVEVGNGSALSKQAAKDIAAKMAMQMLDWTW